MRRLGTKSFTDRYPFFGPAMWMLAIVFFVAQLLVAYPWRSKAPLPSGISPEHPYSFFANTISDLGMTSKFHYGTPPIWSPWHAVMNAAFVLLGILMISGSLAVYQEFTEGNSRIWWARFGFGLQGVAGVGVIIVGLKPENTPSHWHVFGAAVLGHRHRHSWRPGSELGATPPTADGTIHALVHARGLGRGHSPCAP